MTIFLRATKEGWTRSQLTMANFKVQSLYCRKNTLFKTQTYNNYRSIIDIDFLLFLISISHINLSCPGYTLWLNLIYIQYYKMRLSVDPDVVLVSRPRFDRYQVGFFLVNVFKYTPWEFPVPKIQFFPNRKWVTKKWKLTLSL